MVDPKIVSPQTRRFFLVLCLAAALISPALSAEACLLRGTVYGDSAPLAGASVKLLPAGGAEPVGTVVTPAGGGFSFTVGAGTYSLVVDAAGFQSSSVKGVVVGTADVTQDVALVGKPSLTGVVRTSTGVPVPGASVTLFQGSDSSFYQYEAWAVTDAEGRYTIDPAPTGVFLLQIGNYIETSPLLPASWTIDIYDFQIAGATPGDVTLPRLASLSGRTVTAEGAVVPGTVLTSTEYYYDWRTRIYMSAVDQSTSDTSGAFALHSFAAGSTDFLAAPPPESGLSSLAVSLALTGDTTRDFVLTRPALTGVVRTAPGVPVAGARVTLLGAGYPNWWQVVAGPVTADGAGRYAFDQAPAGKALLQVESEGGQAGLPPTFKCVFESVDVVGATVKDLTLPPTAALSGVIRDGAGAPVPGTQVGITQITYYNGWHVESGGSSPPADASGAYAVRAFSVGQLDLSVTPPAATGFSEVHQRLWDFWKDRLLDFEVSHIVISGVVRTGDGVPVPGADVRIVGAEFGNWWQTIGSSVTTDGQGRYTIDPAPGGSAYVEVANHADVTGFMPADWSVVILHYGVTASRTLDLTLPKVATLSGRTTDANGVPVPGVDVALRKVLWQDAVYYVVTRDGAGSDGAGAYATRAFALGPTELTVTPPGGSGFVESSPVDFSLAGDQRLNVLLMIVDETPPVIVSGPVAAKITDTSAVIEWQTDEPARGGLAYGTGNPPGTQAAEGDFATLHALALTGLAPGTEYFVSVSASDLAGNGPVTSGVISFRTLPVADTTPPVFTYGPVVSAVTHESAVVEWATDEVSTGTVTYSAAGTPETTVSDGVLGKTHRLVLDGLEASTCYGLVVEAVDVSGNAATSGEMRFTTAEAPDTTPPVIVEGPLVIAVTDTTATVVWTTDEPATSGVSWNDGTRYGLVSDPALVTAHSVTVTGLLPDTGYTLTVSTTDGAGNGPTLSAPLPIRTKPAADRNPPVIIDGPVVKNVTHQSAVIGWETDEPADGVVEYGLAASGLTQRDAHAALTRPHTMTLTGLEASTPYFFRVCSTDAAGNTGCSAVATFTTGDTGAPASGPQVVTGPEVAYSADRTATVVWATDLPTGSVAEYHPAGGAVLRVADGTPVTQHSVTLVNLDPATVYTVQVSGTDMQGRQAVAPAAPVAGRAVGTAVPALTLTTAAVADTTAPVILEGPAVIALGDTQATVRWVTDEIADTVVRYGAAGTGLAEQTGSIARTTVHQVVLTNLSPGVSYDVQVQSTDPSGNGPTLSGTVTFATAAKAGPPVPLFTEDFSGGDGAWQVWTMGLVVNGGAYVSSKTIDGLSTIGVFDPQAAPLTAGVVAAKVQLTPVFRVKANGAIVFAELDTGHYRYVRLEPGRVVIGQVGRFGGVVAGAKKSLAAAVALNRAKKVTVKIYRDGWVRVLVGTTKVGGYKFPAAIAGGVGLATVKAKTLFDDVAVWGEPALAP